MKRILITLAAVLCCAMTVSAQGSQEGRNRTLAVSLDESFRAQHQPLLLHIIIIHNWGTKVLISEQNAKEKFFIFVKIPQDIKLFRRSGVI